MEKQKKVLFVVYRTEWWGCLDSYCRKECLAEDTLCYVMPVPRYERDEGTFEANFGKKHFDPEKLAAMLPEGACMVDCEEFSLEQGFARIYIHNPYDNGSPLDTVDVKYYSSNLKQYTEELIYVSHFLNLIPEGYANCKVYDYVDTIYIPNGNARFSLDVEYDGKAKVMPSGIPEYLDRLAEKMASGQWKAVCQQKADGKRGRNRGNDSLRRAEDRMKLLYCVSFNDLYYGTEKQLRKMKDIFNYMQRNQNVVLIFRPDEDIRARRQQLDASIWEGYEKLVAYFKGSRIGIYDECPGLYEAAVEADGIMCVSHPMEVLFSVQGKYVLRVDWVQRVVPTVEDRCIPVIWDAVVEETGDKIVVWFAPEKTRLICKMIIPGGGSGNASEFSGRRKAKKHLSGPKVEIVAEVPDEIVGGLNYANIIKIGTRFYLSPYVSDSIWKFDFGKGEFSKQYLPNADNACVTATFQYGKYLYMVPRNYPGIIKYNTETEEIVIIDGWIRELEKYVSVDDRDKPYFIFAVKQEKNMLYIASAKCDVWMEFNMDTNVWSLKAMGLSGKKFVHMIKDGVWVWLLPFCGNDVILWNCRTNERCIVRRATGNEIGNTPYILGLDLGSVVVAFPQQKTNHLLVMEKAYLQDRNACERNAWKEDEFMDREADIENAFLMEKRWVREIKEGIPCDFGSNLTEYQRQRNEGYQFVKMLDSGLILAYEYYDGSFLLLDRELHVVRKTPCRLPIEVVRQQEDIMLTNIQCRDRFNGGLSEGYSLPVMVEYFVRHGLEKREEIRRHHRRYYLESLQRE